MGKFIYLANIIAADVDFYNIEGNRGDSYLPFIGFMMFVVGAVVAFMGFSKYITAKKNFNLFYDLRDSVKVDKATNEKKYFVDTSGAIYYIWYRRRWLLLYI